MFANEDATLTSQYGYISNVQNYILEKAEEEGCWVVMSIDPSSAWETICNPDNDLIDAFATNIVNAINTYGFDGVDIDWECPSDGQEEWFTTLVQTVYTKVKANNENHIVSAAIGGGKWQHIYYDLNNSAQYLDYINLMCYGLSSAHGYYQNALYKNTASYNDTTNNVGKTLVSCSIEESIEIFNSTYNIPYSKMLVGMAFYGVKQTRTYTDGVWSSWESYGNIKYTTLKESYIDNTEYTYVYDSICQVPYLVKNDGTEFISYDNPTSIAAKCNYVKDNNIGGVFYWQNGGDTTGDLLAAVKTTLNK